MHATQPCLHQEVPPSHKHSQSSLVGESTGMRSVCTSVLKTLPAIHHAVARASKRPATCLCIWFLRDLRGTSLNHSLVHPRDVSHSDVCEGVWHEYAKVEAEVAGVKFSDNQRIQ